MPGSRSSADTASSTTWERLTPRAAASASIASISAGVSLQVMWMFSERADMEVLLSQSHVGKKRNGSPPGRRAASARPVHLGHHEVDERPGPDSDGRPEVE